MAQILQATDDDVPDTEDSGSVEHDQSHIHLLWEILVCTHVKIGMHLCLLLFSSPPSSLTIISFRSFRPSSILARWVVR
jgi:hypothetical protein